MGGCWDVWRLDETGWGRKGGQDTEMSWGEDGKHVAYDRIMIICFYSMSSSIQFAEGASMEKRSSCLLKAVHSVYAYQSQQTAQTYLAENEI